MFPNSDVINVVSILHCSFGQHGTFEDHHPMALGGRQRTPPTTEAIYFFPSLSWSWV